MTQTQQVDLYQIMYVDLTAEEKENIHIQMYNASKSVSDPHLRFFEHPINYANNIREGFINPDEEFNFMRDKLGNIHLTVREPLH